MGDFVYLTSTINRFVAKIKYQLNVKRKEIYINNFINLQKISDIFICKEDKMLSETKNYVFPTNRLVFICKEK